MKTRKIPPVSIGVNETGDDIFSYFRTYFNVSDPHNAKIITITASSTYPEGQNQRADPATIIMKDDGTRWVSYAEKDPCFTINFHSNYVALTAYTVISNAYIRYNKNWDLFGIYRGKKYLIDRRINEKFCGEKECPYKIIQTYSCQYPGFFNKFLFISTGPDSYSESVLSMSSIKFYGVVTSNYAIATYQHRCSNRSFINFMILMLLS